MNYPSPKKVLTYLASHGPSATQLEALRMLGLPNCPDRWPECPRRSRQGLLRRLACNSKKSASARLQALKEVLRFDEDKLNPADELDAEMRALLSGQPPSRKPDAVNTQGPNPVPASAVPKAQAVPSPATTPASEVAQDVQKVNDADVQKADAIPIRPQWREDPTEANKLAAELAAKRYRETFSVWDWAVLGHRLAEERQKKPKAPRLMIGGPGGELCD